VTSKMDNFFSERSSFLTLIYNKKKVANSCYMHEWRYHPQRRLWRFEVLTQTAKSTVCYLLVLLSSPDKISDNLRSEKCTEKILKTPLFSIRSG